MDDLKRQNSNANWANLFTGVAVLVMVAVFSYVYFNKAKEGNVTVSENAVIGEVTQPEIENTVEEVAPEIKDTGTEPTQLPFDTSTSTTVVQKGEGLWHVAQRVCGDGEKYNILAQANGLMVWEDLNEGMTLKVVCN